MRREISLTSAEMGAAAVVMLAQLQDCKTEKQAQAHWNRLAAMLRAQISVIKKQPLPRTASMKAISKHWQVDGSFYYQTAWEYDDGI